MLKLTLETSHALFLDHQQLIYNAFTATNPQSYKLKDALFNFQPKSYGTLHEQAPDTAKKKIKKRKRENENDSNDTSYDKLERVNKYLNLLHKHNKLNAVNTIEEIPRFWETNYAVPQLHGANISGSFQTYETTTNSYIIPNECRFFNHNIERLVELLPQLELYDLIIIDPPWRNKYIRRLKRIKHELGYVMLENKKLAELPIKQLIHKNSLVAIWCTNAAQHQKALLDDFLPHWQLRLLHKLRWYKLNTAGQLISEVSTAPGHKQPYETLFIACHQTAGQDYALDIHDTELLMSIPSIVHSHKPPIIDWLKTYVHNGVQAKCLELFARYLQPQCTSIGLEVLKLMDIRLYEQK